MSLTPEQEKHEWERAKEAREKRQHEFDIGRLSMFLKTIVPIALALIAISQGYLAWIEYRDKSTREETSLRLAYAEANLMWAKEVSERLNLLFSQNPTDVCRAVEILRIASPPAPNGENDLFFLNNIGRLRVNALMCYSPEEFEKAVASFQDKQWGMWRLGALSPYIRRNPVGGQLFYHQCDVMAIGKAGLSKGSCELPKEITGKIYRVEFICADYKCGWSYGAKKGEYGAVYAMHDRKIDWTRIWDGDAHLESYVLYYETPQPAGDPPKA